VRGSREVEAMVDVRRSAREVSVLRVFEEKEKKKRETGCE